MSFVYLQTACLSSSSSVSSQASERNDPAGLLTLLFMSVGDFSGIRLGF